MDTTLNTELEFLDSLKGLLDSNLITKEEYELAKLDIYSENVMNLLNLW